MGEAERQGENLRAQGAPLAILLMEIVAAGTSVAALNNP